MTGRIAVMAVVFLAAAVSFGSAHADYTFTTVDPPGASGASGAVGINNSGQIVGSYEVGPYNQSGTTT